MRIYSFNVNGIRAAVKKGLLDWIEAHRPDVLCLQEIKALKEQMPIDEFVRMGYEVYINSAEKKGYSGVAVLSKAKAKALPNHIGHEVLDKEGRVLALDFESFILINTYFPSGTTPERQALKMDFLEAFNRFIKDKSSAIITGDFNICHHPMDIHDPVKNTKTPGFLPEERAWMDKLEANGFVDAFRIHNTAPDQYSWWSYRTNARARNKGWRIDYIMVPQRFQSAVKNAGHDYESFHSDHCPVWASVDI
ncbi:MAG: exodeoxyribonuclease III [Cryomorphaceae bacterium]|nr:exodeoxyribonuclease III [Cryomorphaceae bacterium]